MRADVICSYFFAEVLGDLGSLSRACLPLNDQHLVLLNGGQQVPPVWEDGEAASDLLHGLLLQLCLGESWGLPVLNAREAKAKSKLGCITLFSAPNTTCLITMEI